MVVHCHTYTPAHPFQCLLEFSVPEINAAPAPVADKMMVMLPKRRRQLDQTLPRSHGYSHIQKQTNCPVNRHPPNIPLQRLDHMPNLARTKPTQSLINLIPRPSAA